MPDIRQLSTSVVNKIAAGEVIERPASVVKELMENSVDAGAKRVDVTLVGGGSDLIRVADDGCGISREQLALAVASHATSKIRSADDLFHVATMGFRGEALASIAEISQFLIRSRTPDDDAGAELEVEGGQHRAITPCGAPIGTTIEIRNLFYNTPVRRKFLRTVQTETGHASEAFTRIALAWPEVHFTLRHNDRLLFDLPPTADRRERIGAFFTKELEYALIPVDSRDGGVRLTGYVADPQQNRANNRMQYLFLNRRHIRDRSLQHALSEAYRGLLLHGRFPIAFLDLEMPVDAVDVNVHPTKLEVRFADSGRLYSQLLGALRKKFLTTDLTAHVRQPDRSVELPADDAALDAHRRELVDWARGQLPVREATATAIETNEADAQGSLELQFDRSADKSLQLVRFDRAALLEKLGATETESRPAAPSQLAPQAPTKSASWEATPVDYRLDAPSASPRPMIGFQIHNKYLVTETAEGMIVIDQHALHERILYEQFREKVLAGRLETQRLLVPEPVTLPPAEAAAAIDNQAVLAKLGLTIEPFGGDTVLVTGYPSLLGQVSPAELLRQAVEILVTSEKEPDRRDLVDEMLNMMSCKAAVKAGDPLSTEEITSLLEQRQLVQDTHHCPHGRPTSLVFTREELDKRFKRV